MDKQPTSIKRIAIVKANARNVATVGVAAFITIFCLMAVKAVVSENQYLGRVIKAKTAAHSQLVTNISAANQLVQSYQKFVSTPTNVIGNATQGTGDNQGDNAKIILDALPSQYDFPALTSSLEKILDSLNIKGDISGTDDSLSQQGNGATANPQPTSIPFSLDASGVSYASVQQLITKLQASIRPMQIDTLNLSGATNSMTVSITAHTYYQPGKSLSITKEVVK